LKKQTIHADYRWASFYEKYFGVNHALEEDCTKIDNPTSKHALILSMVHSYPIQFF
jgi:hypothetical protein